MDNNIVPAGILITMISRASLLGPGLACKTAITVFWVILGASSLAAAEVKPWGRFVTNAAIVSNPDTHKVYAVCEGAGSIVVIEAATGSMHTVAVGRGPISIAVNRVTNRIYVANDVSASVSVIEGKNDTVIATVPVARLPYTLAVDESTNKVYISHTYSGLVTVIDGASNTATSLKIGDADGIAIDPQRGKVFLYTYEDPNIRILDEATGGVTKVAVGPHIWGMAFDASSSTLYLAHTAADEIVALNENTHAVSAIPVGKIPCALALNPETHTLYVANYGDDTVSIINLKAHRVLATLPVGRHPQGLAVDSQSNRIYVANLHGDSVTVIDGEKNAINSTRSAGRQPYGLAIDSHSGKLYAANYGSPWLTQVTLGN